MKKGHEKFYEFKKSQIFIFMETSPHTNGMKVMWVPMTF